MKRLILGISFAAVCLIAFGFTEAFAYSIDGSLTDWGVTPFSDWVPDSSTAHGTVSDDRTPSGGYVAGGEFYDVEAMYFDNDEDNAYFAMVSSYPLWYSWSGDIAIDFSPYGSYEYGLRTRGLTLGSTSAQLRSNPTWYRNRMNYLGSLVGTAQIAYVNAGYFAGDSTTYILEGLISNSLFNPVPVDGTSLRLYWGEYCYNDWIQLTANFDLNGENFNGNGEEPIPEPNTLILLGTGLLGLMGAGAKRFRKK